MEKLNVINNNERFEKLKEAIQDYLEVKDTIKTGIEDEEKIEYQKRKILSYFGASEKDWENYKWQLKNRVASSKILKELLNLDEKEAEQIEEVAKSYRFAISPYYLSLIDPDNPNCPIKKQSVPSSFELIEKGELDPMDEEHTSPTKIITQRYPDRLIIKVTNICGMFCRFCQRRRLIGETDTHASLDDITDAIEYVAQNPNIRDVLITGGDALMLSDEVLDWILRSLRQIPHVEIIRIGTRAPVTLPQRITKELVDMLKKYHPIYINTHFNHPREITKESKRACEMLSDAGVPLGNQMVLLNGVNNDKYVVRKLNQELLKIRVKPYYIFHPKRVKGTSHFWVTIEEGMEIIESLRGRTSGMAVPTYIINAPKGKGKTPIMPNYLLYFGKDKVVFRNWEGEMFEVENG
ncbi:lysine 2,3-aminomutase YodO family protein [Caldicellulosiruptor kronotskyensis 2002]|uniref:Lysine 2,3-aminomutase YodO family protein n=1 Tax=Caldicellulosiruptor kronotskyensis (strain DSM 18902 / VKM B-2412 / 2002) TaxID=632348 RepID=E4SDX2_CALK2|nr:glutamate 2,3-aminomutase [Caldicellulosiruptor kronotskyensis]ADQ45259.1 lysine 2,3-aminomutase YodO family protein [Caldicellulosiruptor kronotskyensis 2002]